MPCHQIRFIATDMDGSLLNEQGQLPDGFFPLFEQIDKHDILFAAASGRQYYSLAETFASIKDRMLFIAENGTLVIQNDEILYSCGIEKSVTDKVIKQTRELDGAFVVLCGKKSAYIETQDATAVEEIKKYYHRCQYVDDLTQVNDEFIKVAICHFSGTQDNVYPTVNTAFGQELQVVVSAKIWLDVMNKSASKGTAIEFLQQRFDFTQQQTMSFGDYFNDVEMLKVSDFSYAMDNAHPEIKALANYIAPSNRDSGVLTVIRDYLQDLEQ
ncbi:Cof-type HAD-IIB family hydrolase [Vibrio hippocampi]|uniref:5-amino-6-(5-phospho-D-ribitylamino)uracil phosphatase YbjI n=1 Tax=Vibrio hippocampi TaxID=654686 RepID=A0ABN8DEL7_9VIBR|nr:Cof-type HAD-IIB family hydrolase [Vibrio hippocampi]CAH0525537.1 5-amino-6-(5-phospho-D-ribitylamino)uracil phosphatase YbjI [Vibrio hippocampi]